MRSNGLSLGAKLNLALLVFVLILGAATLAIVLYGFNRTQDDATDRSQQALEEEGKLALEALAGGVSESGALQFESAAEVAQRASRYMEEFKASGGTPVYDASRFVSTDAGVLYDPSPDRKSDVVVLNHGQLEGAVLEDIAYTAGLDPLFPALAEPFPGQLSGEAYNPIAVIYVGISGVGRYYPPIGIHESTPAEIDVSDFYDRFGPVANPSRETVWTTPYEHLNGRGLVITAQTPVYEGDTFKGIFEVDLAISKLVELVNSIKPTPGGFTFYVDTDGSILQTDSFDFLTNEAQNNETLVRILDAMKSPSEEPSVTVEKLSMGGEDYFISHTGMAMPGGSIGVAAPVDELTADAAIINSGIEDEGNRTFIIIVVALGALFVGGLIAATYLNRRVLVVPIRELAGATDAVAAGDLETRVEIERTDELGSLGRSFNTMVEQLRESERQLEQRVTDRTRELSALLEISRALSSTLTLERLVEVILDELKAVIDYSGASVIRLTDTGGEVVDSRGPAGREEQVVGLRVQFDRTTDWVQSVAAGGPVVFANVREREEESSSITRAILAEVDTLEFAYVVSFMIVPLISDGRLVGILTMSKDIPDYFRDEHVRLGTAFAAHAAAAIANATLFEETQRTARERAVQLEVTRAVASKLELQPLLETILDQLYNLMSYAGAAIVLVDGDIVRQVALRRPRGSPVRPEDRAVVISVTRIRELGFGDLIDRPLIIDDVHADSPLANAYRAINGGDLKGAGVDYIRSFASVPLVARDRVVGVLTLSHETPGFIRPEHVELLRPLSDQAATAIENASLYHESQRSARETAALFESSRAVVSSLEVSDVIQTVLREISTIIEHTGASVLLIKDGALEFFGARSTAAETARTGMRIPVEFGDFLWEPFERGEAVIIDDIRADSEYAVKYRAAISSIGQLDQPPFNIIRSWMGVPLLHKGATIGMITFSWTEPGYFTPEHGRLARAFADQVALAIENARLFDETQKGAREFEALSRADTELFRSLDLDAVLQALVDVTVDVLGVDQSMVTTWDMDTRVMSLRAWRNLNERTLAYLRELFGRRTQSMDAPQVIVTPDPSRASAHLLPIFESEGIQSMIEIPIVSRDGRPHGFFGVGYSTNHYFTMEEQRLLMAVADRAAVAISNAELYQKAQQVASLEERQRLARELHDSVSQALYGIALGARTARTQLDRDPAKVAEPLEYVLSLAEAGLAEMRALIFELRPESLETEGLVAAISKQASAVKARYGIDVDFAEPGEPEASLDVKEAAYRVAQEALHNIVKHSKAKQVTIGLASNNGTLALTIRDDGAGFDPSADYAGHLGLKSMRERAERAGGRLTIDSAPGRGSTVSLELPVRR